MAATTRDARFDTLKGILILCVLFRHFYLRDSEGVTSEAVAHFIHFFTMPLFVFMSGFFTRHEDDTKRYWLGILGILETYFVFQLFKGLAYHYSVVELITLPAPMMWYLLALIYWKVLYFILYKSRIRVTILLILVLVILSLAAGFVPFIDRRFAVSRFLYFSPYFFLGILLRKKQVLIFINDKIKWYYAAGVLAMTLVLSFFLAYTHNPYVADIFRGVKPYPASNQLYFLLARLASFLFSIIVSIAIFRFAAFPCPILETVGKDSLKFYMFQGIGLMIVGALNLPSNFLLATLYAVVVSVAIFYFDKFWLSDFALRPIKYIIDATKRKKIVDK